MQTVIPADRGPRGVGLREAKKAATRRQLSSAARRLASEQGLDALTVESICHEVGVSVRTFFNYFESKDTAILGDSAPLGTDEAITIFVAGGPTGDLLDDLLVLLDPTDVIELEGREQLVLLFGLIRSEPRILALQLARGAGHEEELAGAIAARRGLTEPDGSCRTVAAVGQTLVRRAVMDWFFEGSERPLEDYLRLAVEQLTELLGGPPID